MTSLRHVCATGERHFYLKDERMLIAGMTGLDYEWWHVIWGCNWWNDSSVMGELIIKPSPSRSACYLSLPCHENMYFHNLSSGIPHYNLPPFATDLCRDMFFSPLILYMAVNLEKTPEATYQQWCAPDMTIMWYDREDVQLELYQMVRCVWEVTNCDNMALFLSMVQWWKNNINR